MEFGRFYKQNEQLKCSAMFDVLRNYFWQIYNSWAGKSNSLIYQATFTLYLENAMSYVYLH